MRIPISTAKDVAEKHDLKQVLLIGWDGEQVHLVTYGVDKENCRQAARAQDFWAGRIKEFSFKQRGDLFEGNDGGVREGTNRTTSGAIGQP